MVYRNIYTKNKWKTIQKSQITKEDLKNHIRVIDLDDLYYAKGITNDMVTKYAKAKYYIFNSTSNEMKQKIDFESLSA